MYLPVICGILSVSVAVISQISYLIGPHGAKEHQKLLHPAQDRLGAIDEYTQVPLGSI